MRTEAAPRACGREQAGGEDSARSWSAPALWRFGGVREKESGRGPGGGELDRAWEESGRGLPHSKTLARHRIPERGQEPVLEPLRWGEGKGGQTLQSIQTPKSRPLLRPGGTSRE